MDIGLLVLLMINAIVVAAFGLGLVGARVMRAPKWRHRASLPAHDR